MSVRGRRYIRLRNIAQLAKLCAFAGVPVLILLAIIMNNVYLWIAVVLFPMLCFIAYTRLCHARDRIVTTLLDENVCPFCELQGKLESHVDPNTGLGPIRCTNCPHAWVRAKRFADGSYGYELLVGREDLLRWRNWFPETQEK